MKRRNAESGKMRRPLKRTKITEGMYGNSMLYLKFVIIWATVVMADYMLEFRFEFLWPFWMMLRSVYDSFKYQGLAFSVFFICIALTSDMICFFFIPLQYVFFAASTYVWVQYVWFTFADKGICLPTVALCCLVVYAEGALRGARSGPLELWRPLAAHCVGYPALSLGFGVKAYVGRRLRLRRQRQVRAENEFYFQLMRDALPESALAENQSKEERANGSAEHMNGSVRRRCARADHNGLCVEHAHLHVKLEKLEKHLAQQTLNRERDKLVQAFAQDRAQAQAAQAQAQASQAQAQAAHAHSNGTAHGAEEHDTKHDSKGGAKSSKCEKKEASSSLREEKRKHKNKDKEREKDSYDSHSHKSIEHIKEHIVKEKEFDSTKESIKSNRDSSNHKEREREREKDREMREREKERERERERELRSLRECGEELKRVKAELAAARAGEAEARRALAAQAAADRLRRADHAQLRHQHAALQHKASSWRTGERAALERRLSEERRARVSLELQLRAARSAPPPAPAPPAPPAPAPAAPAPAPSPAASGNGNGSSGGSSCGECESEACAARVRSAEAEGTALRRELQRARERAAQLQRDLHHATEQVRALETRKEESASSSPSNTSAGAGAAAAAGAVAGGGRLVSALAALQERAAHLERSLSAETRVKLDLLSALGDAKRHMHLQDGVITRQEKEMEELKAQMLAVMPAELAAPARAASALPLRLADRRDSPLDPNASVYTPKQLCSDA